MPMRPPLVPSQPTDRRHPPKRPRRLARRAAPLALLGLAGCLATSGAPAGRAAVPAGEAPPHRIYDTREGRFVDFAAMDETLAGVDVVFFGEQHGDPVSHALQRRMLEALVERRGSGILTMEQFERDIQIVLDMYLVGGLPEAEFLADARPWSDYRRDYRPLVEFAREEGIPVVAANIPQRIAAQVARQGVAALDALAAGDREYAAREIACPHDDYYRRFRVAITGDDEPGHGGGAALDRLYEAQCVRDETMAESIVEARLRTPGPPILHTTGVFHSDFGLGTVQRTARRAPNLRIALVSTVPVPELESPPVEEHRGRAHFLVFTREAESGER